MKERIHIVMLGGQQDSLSGKIEELSKYVGVAIDPRKISDEEYMDKIYLKLGRTLLENLKQTTT